MGIDLYAKWEGMTVQEAEDQITGFSVTAGSVGYLREAYHGDPYATIWLAPEAFATDGYEDAQRAFGGGIGSMMGAITEALGTWEVGGAVIVEPAELAPSCDGFPPEGYLVECEIVERPWAQYPDESYRAARIPAAVLRRRLPICLALCERRYGSDCQDVKDSFVGFVALYERLEQEGRSPGVYASF